MQNQKSEIKKFVDYLLIVFSIFLGVFLGRNTFQVLLFAFLIWQILFPLSSKYLARFSIFLLTIIPMAFLIRQDEIASEMAIAAFYLITLTLVMLCVRMNNNQEEMTE